MRSILVFILLLTFGSHAIGQTLSFKRSDTVTVIHTAGDTLELAWTGGMNYCQFWKVDMDMDGIKDLIAFDRTGDHLLPFKNSGAPSNTYTYQPKWATYFPSGLNNWIYLVDYNCDGKEDLFTYFPGGIRVYKNISDTILKFQLYINGPMLSNQLGNNINLLVTSVDIPAIKDVDYDGDLDILTFGQFGKRVEYHKNYSVENGFGCDTLSFIMKNDCWGCFYESSTSCSITTLDTCALNPFIPGGPELAPPPSDYRALSTLDFSEVDTSLFRSSSQHSGSAVLALDLNGQNAMDLLISDVSCTHFIALTNGGTAPNMNTCMTVMDPAFPSYDTPLDITIFPAAFHIDINNDGKRDLVAAPNYTVGSINQYGNQYYQNTGTDLSPIFQQTTIGFMQKDMIEVGEGAVPVFFDHNGDGLTDLVIANFGVYDIVNYPYQRYVSKLLLYENTGTASLPTFTLVNNDMGSVFSVLDTASLLPTFGDLDNDGDPDMIVGDINGRLHYFLNTAGAGNPSVFVLTTSNILNNNIPGDTIDVGTYAAPHLADLDQDGDLDLIVGERNANLNYYENVGGTSAFNFKYITNNFGDVHVNESFTPYGHSIPYTVVHNNELHLYVGSQKGKVYHYDSVYNNLTGVFHLVDSLPDAYSKFGIRTAPALADLNNDTLPDLIVGNYRGGLSLYMGHADDSTSGIQELTLETHLELFPNPATDQVRIVTEIKGAKTLRVRAMDGRLIQETTFSGMEHVLSLKALSAGAYILEVIELQQQARKQVGRLIKQ